MLLLEYEAKRLLNNVGIKTPKGKLVDDSYKFQGKVILKAQVPIGGRGKSGGIIKVTNEEVFTKEVSSLHKLKIKGHPVTKILAEEMVKIEKEYYFSLMLDQVTEEIRLLAHIEGGVDVEDREEKPFSRVITSETISQVADDLRKLYNFENSMKDEFLQFTQKVFDCFINNDARLIEINPLVVLNHVLVAVDCKIEIDDNALFRHPKLADHTPDANFVLLNTEGDTAVVANGAGLAMATVDQVNSSGLIATNFLDIGGGADVVIITKQFTRLAELSRLKAIIINIFAGITRCDQVAEAVVAARNNIGNLPPFFIRLHGTNYDEAKDILDKAEIRLFRSLHDCIEAAKNV